MPSAPSCPCATTPLPSRKRSGSWPRNTTGIDFAVSVTTKRTSTPSRFTLPGTTMPPMRKVRPTGASLAATCDGVKKNTRFLLNAVRTSAVATPSATTPSAIHAMRLCLGFTLSLYQQHHFDREQHERDSIAAPHVERITAHVKEVAHRRPK